MTALMYRWVPKFWTHGSVCCAYTQKPGLLRESFSRTLRLQNQNSFLNSFLMGPKRNNPMIISCGAQVLIDSMSETELRTRLLAVETDNFKLTEELVSVDHEMVCDSTLSSCVCYLCCVDDYFCFQYV